MLRCLDVVRFAYAGMRQKEACGSASLWTNAETSDDTGTFDNGILNRIRRLDVVQTKVRQFDGHRTRKRPGSHLLREGPRSHTSR